MMLLLASLLGQALAQPANRTGDDYACEGGVCVRQVGGPYTSLDQCLNDGSCGTPPPPPSRDRPAACDLQFAPDGVTRGCSCDGYDLSQAKGQVLRTAADAAGYTIIFSLCTEIPAAAIPRGCKSFVEMKKEKRRQLTMMRVDTDPNKILDIAFKQLAIMQDRRQWIGVGWGAERSSGGGGVTG